MTEIGQSNKPPAPPKFGDKVVAAIKWVDGTVIDCVRAVEIQGPTAAGGE
jgi:citrate lyase alpha subunit